MNRPGATGVRGREPPDDITRRGFLGAGAAAAITLGAPGTAAAADRPNVLVLVVDTLRADHVFGDHARTPTMNALMRRGLRFTALPPGGHAHGAVPQLAALRAAHLALAGWHDWPGLLDAPGLAADRGRALVAPAGAPPGRLLDRLRDGQPVPRLRAAIPAAAEPRGPLLARGGQLGGSGRGVPDRELYHWLHPALRADAKIRTRVRKFLASADEYWRDESRSFAARVYRSGVEALNVAATQRPFALVVDTFEPHEPWTPPRKYIDLYGDRDYRGREPGMPRYGKIGYYVQGARAGPACSRGCAPSTRPRSR